MDKLTLQNSILSRPFKVHGTAMHPNLLLMCKIFTLLLFAHGFFSQISDPYIPVLPFLDSFNVIPYVFEYSLKSIFIVATIFLFLNIKTRVMAITLGVVVIVSVLGSKSLFRNHLFIVGCALFLSGLIEKDQKPWLIFLQLSLVYFGALINKIWQMDWWSGQFMDYWLSEALNNNIYKTISKYLPELLLAKIISYSAMLSELVIAICLLISKWRPYGITLILIFHTMLFTFTGETFGFFMEDIMILLIAFMVWPKHPVSFTFRSHKFSNAFKFINLLDWDSRIDYTHNPNLHSNFELKGKHQTYNNFDAVTRLLIYSPGFFIVLVFIEMSIRFFFNGTSQYAVMLVFLWTLLFSLIPMLPKTKSKHQLNNYLNLNRGL